MTKRLGRGKYLELVYEGGYEFARRLNVSGVVAVVAVTADRELVLTDQYRPAVKRRVLDLPAGLAGDTSQHRKESLAAAAKRELLEETGFKARSMKPLFAGPPSAGMSTEVVTFFLAPNVVRVEDGGGHHSEAIHVHLVPISRGEQWLKRTARRAYIDPKVYAGLWFAERLAD
jgi:ADP-ribose pyrophosphatase